MRKFGMLFQGGALFDSLPVWENVAFGLIQSDGMAPRQGQGRRDRQARQRRPRRRRSASSIPSELSGGMQKRVALARAIAREPEIIFFDEPTTGLDPIMADVINDLIVKCVSDLGATAVSITHDMASARKIGDRIAMLYDGKMIWQGPAARSTAPATPMSTSSSMAAPKDRSRCRSGSSRRAMARPIKRFVCQSCGAVTTKWSGRCEIVRRVEHDRRGIGAGSRPAGGGLARGGKGRLLEFAGLTGSTPQPPRYKSGIAEFDRVCGGGLVVGSALLIGGDPGIGKSTLLLQMAAALAKQNTACAYISGEEAVDQVRLRAERLGLADAPVAARRRNLGARHRGGAGAARRAQVAVIDSIQTMWLDTLDSTPGTVTQVRASAQALVGLAKRRGIAVLLVGHVTKDGAIAGPRVLEHMVDTVLYFEGERGHQFRILRAVKNRFGPTDEIGVFEMSDRGLSDVANPSALFLAERRGHVAGACVFAGIEGTRPVLVEIQALVSPSSLGTPRRAVVGWDYEPAGHGAGRAGGALRRRYRRQRRLSERRRRPAHQRAGGRPRGRRGRRFVPGQRAGAARHGGLRRDRPGRRGPSGGPARGATA